MFHYILHKTIEYGYILQLKLQFLLEHQYIKIVVSLSLGKHSLCGYTARKGIVAHFELYF